jgi:hypothetical protein
MSSAVNVENEKPVFYRSIFNNGFQSSREQTKVRRFDPVEIYQAPTVSIFIFYFGLIGQLTKRMKKTLTFEWDIKGILLTPVQKQALLQHAVESIPLDTMMDNESGKLRKKMQINSKLIEFKGTWAFK